MVTTRSLLESSTTRRSNKYRKKYMITRKIGFGSKTISNLNWESLCDLGSVDAAQAKNKLETFRNNHVMPQLMAFIGGTGITLHRNEDGKVSTEATLKALSKVLDANEVHFLDGTLLTKKAFNGMLQFMATPTRSSIMPVGTKQISPEWARFSSAVPLFMSAFKEFRNVNYKEWDLQDPFMQYTTDPRTISILRMAGTEIGWDSSKLLEFQKEGRTVKTGATAGTVKHLNSATSITGVSDEDFSALPSLVKVMLCQTWVFQPGLYTKYGLYNLMDIDAKAEPLIVVDVVPRVPQDTETFGWDA